MSADATTLVIPGHGTVFTATKNTAPPANPLNAFSLTGAAPAGWTSLGHTSKANTIAFTKEGGEQESLDTFLADAVRTTTASTSWGVTVPALQFDPENLALAFNGQFNPTTGGYVVATPAPVERALFLYFQDTTGELGFWIPDTVNTLGDAPSVDTAQFLELPLSSRIQSAAAGVIPPVNGRAGLFEIFKSGLANPTAGWTMTITGTPTGGSYTLTVDGQSTAPIPHNANNTAIAAALNAIPGVTGTTVTGSGPYVVTFTSARALTARSAFTGGTNPNVTVAHT